MSPARSKAPPPLLVRGAHVLTLDDAGTSGKLDLRLEGGRIAAVGPELPAAPKDKVIDARGLVAIPGLVQAHVHLCQTLLRGAVEGHELLGWLREHIWPFEAALRADELAAGARVGIAELLLAGTTSVLDVGTTHDTDALFAEAERLGIRYTGGKAVMDYGQGYPSGMRDETAQAIAACSELCERWHGKAAGRLRYAFIPRFTLSCTDEAIAGCVREARRHGALLHTHVAESSEEVALARERAGSSTVEHLHRLGMTGADVVLAHGVWLSSEERRILRETRTSLVHCPSSNLKLGGGLARLRDMLDEDIVLALGADGAACNNNLDPFLEMRLAALVHSPRSGPSAVPAAAALRMATRGGATALGLEAGVLAPGKLADVVLLDLDKPHAVPGGDDLATRIVFSAKSSDVHTVIVDGKVLVKAGKLVGVDPQAIVAEAQEAAARVLRRVRGD